MSYIKVVIFIAMLIGGLYYVQSPEKKLEIKDSIKDKIKESFIEQVDEEVVEGIIVEEDGNQTDVLFYGRPRKVFDCASDEDCNTYIPLCDKDCSCQTSTGRCYVVV